MIPITKKFPLGKLIEQFQSRKDVHSVFGVLIYTENDPHVIKVLRDDDFWKALDTASGPRWPIFSVRPQAGRTIISLPKETPGALQFLITIPKWHEPSDNRTLLDAFAIQDTSELPMLMVFAESSGKEALRIAFKISGKDVDKCYESLKGAIQAAAMAIKDVEGENIKNTFEVFNLMESAIRQHIWFHRIKVGLSFAKLLKSISCFFEEKE